MSNISENIIEQNEDRINRYLFGKMSPEEEAQFESELKNDDQFRQQAESMAQMVKAMDAVGAERDKEMISKMKSSSRKTQPMKMRWLSIAASFALILTVGYYVYDYNRIGNLGEEYASAFPFSTIVRGEEDDNAALKLTALFENVTNGEDLDNTISQLTELWSISQSDTYNEYTTYAPYIGWNLAIAHLRNHDKKEAKSILEEMTKIYPKGTAFGDKVIELKRKILP